MNRIVRYILIIVLVIIGKGLKAQDTLVIQSDFIKTRDSVLVFKPSVYSEKSQYPTLYLLHGHSANFKSWSKLADLKLLANKYGFIIVCPDGLKSSWYIDSPLKDSMQYESFFIKELMPYVAAHYKVDAENVFITGASMGGHGALWLFANHSDLFKSAGSTSGVVNLRHSGFKKTTLAAHLGPYAEDNRAFDDFSVINNIQKLTGTGKAFLFDCGTEDYLYKANKSLRDKCDELKLKATYTTQPGAHTGGYWSTTILQHLEFFARQIK